MDHYKLFVALAALGFVMMSESGAVAQSDLGPSNPMELAVALANARVPAGIVIPDAALASYRTTFPGAQVSADVLNAGLVERVTRFKTPLQVERRGQVWVMQAQSVPADIANRLSSSRYLANTVKSSASHAVFNFVAGLLQETEVTGVLGAGSLPDETCPLQAPVELGAGPTSIVTMLNETVRQAPGLVWFVTYDAKVEQMAIGVVCPGGQYTKMLLR